MRTHTSQLLCACAPPHQCQGIAQVTDAGAFAQCGSQLCCCALPQPDQLCSSLGDGCLLRGSGQHAGPVAPRRGPVCMLQLLMHCARMHVHACHVGSSPHNASLHAQPAALFCTPWPCFAAGGGRQAGGRRRLPRHRGAASEPSRVRGGCRRQPCQPAGTQQQPAVVGQGQLREASTAGRHGQTRVRACVCEQMSSERRAGAEPC